MYIIILHNVQDITAEPEIMYTLLAVLYYKHSKLFDAQHCSVMRDNYSGEEILFRSGKKELDDDRPFSKLVFESRIHKSSHRLRKWIIVILIFLLMSLVIINSYTMGQFRIVRFGSFGNTTAQEDFVELKPYFTPISSTGYLVRNKGCRIPAIDPLDPAIKRFIRKEDPLLCDYGTYLPLIESNETAIFVNPEARDYFYNKTEKAECCWRSFWRTNDEDNAVTYDKECHSFDNSDNINTEFVKVECTRNKERIYRDYYAFLPRKTLTEERCRTAKTTNDREQLSVLVVGIDSVSRMNLHRMMPKTVQILQSLNAVEMLGYTKVADNTFPNLVPVLTGLSQEELHDHCWQNRKKPFDDCPFIWKNFSAAGYRTIFGEDACDMTTFNYLKPGFRVQPTDYYLRPYCIASEHDIGNTHKLNAHLCIGTRKTFENLLHYTNKAVREFASDLYFAFFWQASLTHDFFNYPQLGDDSYNNFIESLSKERLLNHTALIVMSDHGMRWGEFRQTFQGRMEDSLPFVFIILPTWWKEKYPIAWGNLRRNTRSLTTAFDLHETLMDLLNPSSLHETSLRKRMKSLSSEEIPRGISWFLPVPDHRTCVMADIADHWCMCHNISSISLNDTNLQNTADFLVTKLNSMLEKFPQCATLSLKEVKDAKVWMDKADSTSLIDYTVTIQTKPGDAIFEGSIRYRSDDNSRQLVGSISRLNAYGKQSACVDEFNMRLYCYCL